VAGFGDLAARPGLWIDRFWLGRMGSNMLGFWHPHLGIDRKTGVFIMIDIEKLQITTLCDNGVADIEYLGEWGLSLHLSLGDGKDILFDTGDGRTCVPNATAAGIDLGNVEFICLSHGHHDHTGGLLPVLEKIRQSRQHKAYMDIYCHPAALEQQYVKHSDSYFYRGIPFNLEELRRLGARFHTSKKPVWLTDDIVLSGEVPLRTDFEAPSDICFLKTAENQYQPSPVLDDQALFVRTNLGLVVLSGCAHRGIINTLLLARELTGEERIHTVVGGTHLLNTRMSQQERTADMLLELKVRKIGVSHCTGLKPACYLAQRLGRDRFFFNNAGAVIAFKEHDIIIKAFESA
jgi:7,8-dihydropterin-6-yl-methyl-4-(beta-D-ribofuranosyl)aminobenzene 5'-phosphate synthase